ncbi:hypothetical protein HX057_05325 [Myroides odoratimimus]|uniref:toxin-antitoxin system YwqK family antitoxin n=1 Tax=Myroides odoratimimus TaxID=76832 RepID=UPI00217F2554|nr:hypothetical protein [Myroides odoratimimus]MCS7473285.1 hypothetical protein [Myroides odoratimimus]MDM1413922.1 hypothetical protein [Myroides odoratimimus]MDM1446170.1 hypothetical protein [Myroides odoratimimus]MDM1508386.1 hypothetical protein [Myroides odoratimimus]MDM1519005.1 hypothetical protein [Myroides odoratimimus]
MKRIALSLLCLMLPILTVTAQTKIDFTDIEIVNLGDGQRYIKEVKSSTPLNGKKRIINGVTEQYIDVDLKDGLLNGKWEYYDKSKLKELLNFKNGYMDGKQQAFFVATGKPEYEGNMKMGKKHGEWIYFSNNGNKREMEVYADNSMTKRVTYYTSGQVEQERNFKQGKEDGVSKAFTNEGKMKYERTFVNGKQIGKERSLISSNSGDFFITCNYNDKGNKDGDYSEEWADSKKPKAKGKYLNGQKDGKWTEWTSRGDVKKEETYKNGAVVN